MKNIILFGATGGSGKQVVTQALERGYAVTAVIRNPASLAIHHSNLKVTRGDVLQSISFEKEIIGKDVVISCLGTGKDLKPTTIYSRGMENIISAMKNAGVGRLVCISAGALYTNKEMGIFVRALSKIVLQKILKNLYDDMRLMETLVEASGLDWTIVRPARLVNKPRTGNYRTAIQSHLRRPWRIARADLADFMLSSIENKKTFKTKVEIAY
jgi:putative NADH-flavin reductase